MGREGELPLARDDNGSVVSELDFLDELSGRHSRKTSQLPGQIAIGPAGTAESSPGRQSWVYISTKTSPAGTVENAPGRQSWGTWTAREG